MPRVDAMTGSVSRSSTLASSSSSSHRREVRSRSGYWVPCYGNVPSERPSGWSLAIVSIEACGLRSAGITSVRHRFSSFTSYLPSSRSVLAPRWAWTISSWHSEQAMALHGMDGSRRRRGKQIYLKSWTCCSIRVCSSTSVP